MLLMYINAKFHYQSMFVYVLKLFKSKYLNRLFSLHYLLPFLLAGISLLHLVFLH